MRKIHAVQDDAELARYLARVLIILGAAAIGIVRVPVLHVQALHVEAALPQQQRRDRGIDPTGQADNDAHAARD